MDAAPRWTLLPVVALIGVLFLWPMSLVLQTALHGGDAWRWLIDDYARTRIAGGILQATLSLVASLAIAIPLTWLHHRWHIPGSRGLLAIHASTFVLPVFVVVAGLREILGPHGWSARVGVDLLGAWGPWGAVVLANTYYNAGMAAVLLHAAFERRPRILEQAAATLGAPPGAIAARITGPLLSPAFLATGLLVFLFCFASFGVVLLLGEGRIDTLDTLLYSNLRGAFPREDRGAVLAFVQLAVQGTLLALVLALQRRAARSPSALPAIKPKSGLATATAWLLAGATLLPVLAVLVGAFQVGGVWSFEAWRTLLDSGAPGHIAGFHLGHALWLSLLYAVGTVLASLALTLVLAYAARGALTRLVEGMAFLPLGTSSVALGFGFLLAFTGRTWLPLGGTPWIVWAAHTLIAFPFVARTLLPALHAIDANLDAAADVLGAPLRERIRRIHLPLVRRPLAIACAFAAVLSLGDYGASLLLMTDDIAGLSVWIGRHGGPGSFDPVARAQSTALAAVLLALTLAALGLAAIAVPRRRTP